VLVNIKSCAVWKVRFAGWMRRKRPAAWLGPISTNPSSPAPFAANLFPKTPTMNRHPYCSNEPMRTDIPAKLLKLSDEITTQLTLLKQWLIRATRAEESQPKPVKFGKIRQTIALTRLCPAIKSLA